MATTFKAKIYSDLKRQDGTYNVKIRVKAAIFNCLNSPHQGITKRSGVIPEFNLLPAVSAQPAKPAVSPKPQTHRSGPG